MIVKLLTEHYLEFLSLKGGCKGRPSLHMSKFHIVGNLMHWLLYCIVLYCNISAFDQFSEKMKELPKSHTSSKNSCNLYSAFLFEPRHEISNNVVF